MRLVISILAVLLIMWCGNVMGMEIAAYTPLENTGYTSVTLWNEDYYMQQVDNPAFIIGYTNQAGLTTTEIVNVTSEIFAWGWGWDNRDEARTRVIPLVNTSEEFLTGGRYNVTSIELVGVLE